MTRNPHTCAGKVRPFFARNNFIFARISAACCRRPKTHPLTQVSPRQNDTGARRWVSPLRRSTEKLPVKSDHPIVANAQLFPCHLGAAISA